MLLSSTQLRYGSKAVVLLAALVWLGGIYHSKAYAEILQNGDMEAAGADAKSIPGWHIHRWEGEGQVVHADGNAFSGNRMALIDGAGPGKIAIFQSVMLPACTYRLSAMAASFSLAAGKWGLAGQIYIAFDDDTTITHAFPIGDSGWRRMDLVFAVAGTRKATIYFFNYGSGILFVDDVRLEADAPCGKSSVGFSLADTVSAALTYVPPPTVEDRLLSGYCSRQDFAERLVCKRLASVQAPANSVAPAAAPPNSSLVIADFEALVPFEKPSLVSVHKSWRIHTPGLLGERAGLLPGGAALVGDRASGLRQNWSGYDWLEFDVENASGAPQTLTVEIRDEKSTDYWSRVNWDTAVMPGRSTVHIPLQAFVGEKSVIQERRRLDLARITRLVVTTSETASDLIIDTLRLVPQTPFVNTFPELIRLDPGPLASPVMAGFTALAPSMRYRPERGYGISIDAKIGRVEDRRHPDNLLRDWISFLEGGIDIDLPNDTYHVWMMIEDPGYWDYYPSFTHRRVLAEGQVVLDEQRSARDFLERYFRHANDEDRPGDDIWGRYIFRRYKPLEFDVEVKDGQLNIRFDADKDPHAAPLSALIVYPKSQSVRGAAFVAELWDKLKRDFSRENSQILPPLPHYEKPKANVPDVDLSIFQRAIDRDVHATDWPSAAELVTNLTLAAAQDERSALMLGLYSHADLALTDATLELTGIEATPLLVRYKLARANQDGSAFWNVPRVLDPLRLDEINPLVLPAGSSRSLWFDLHIPPDAEPGHYEGRLRLSFKGGKTHELPVGIDILPWRLPPADIPIGYLGIAPTYPATAYQEISQRRVKETSQALRLLTTHGFTAISGGLGGPVFKGYLERQPAVDFSNADQTMNAIREFMQPGEINTYAGLEFSGLPLDAKHNTLEGLKKPYAQVLDEVLSAIKQHGDAGGWPPLLHSIGDEPSGAEIDRVAEIGRLFQQSTSKARTAVFTSMQNPGSDHSAKLAGAVSRIYLTLHNEAAIRHVRGKGSECALYNLAGRYRRGIYLFKMKQLGCNGHLRFALSSVHADPWYDLDGREADYSALFTHSDGQLRLAVDFLRYRQAVTDYRYLLKLEQLIAAAKPGAARSDAKKWFEELLGSMKPESGNDSAWEPSRLEQIRRVCQGHIQKLTK